MTAGFEAGHGAGGGRNALRLLLVNYEYPPIGGGAANATANLARELARLGAQVHVITSRFADLPARECTPDGVEVIRIPTLRRRKDRSSVFEMLVFMASSLLQVTGHAFRWRPAATVAFFGIPSGPSAWLARLLLRTPYLVSLRGGDVPGFSYHGIGIYHRLAGPVIGFLWRRSAGVVANSDGLAELARRFAPDVPIRLIPNGVDAELFAPAPASPPGEGPLRLIIVGRLVHQKGVDCILDAMARCDAPMVLKVVGDGPARSDLEARAQALGLGGRVAFEGWVERAALPARYQAADVFVFPSRDEGMPNVVLEAMACALPVIGTDIPGNHDLILPGVTGALLPVDDVDALSRALGELARDPDLRQRMGRAGRERVVAIFSWQRAAKLYLEEINAAVAEGASGSPSGRRG